MEDPIVQESVKTELEVVEIKKFSLYHHRFSIHYALTVEYPRLKELKRLDSRASQTIGPVWVTTNQMSQMIYYFICFPLLSSSA